MKKIARATMDRNREKFPEYAAKLEAVGKWDGDWLYIPTPALMALWKEYAPSTMPVTLQQIQNPKDPKAFKFNGAPLWAKLHRRPAQIKNYPTDDRAWLRDEINRKLPCGACKHHWFQILQTSPPDFTSERNYFEWSVLAHNRVNGLLDKPLMAMEDAWSRWYVDSCWRHGC